MEIQSTYINTPIQTEKEIKSVYQNTEPLSKVIERDIQQHLSDTINKKTGDNLSIAGMAIGKGIFFDVTV